MESLLTHPWAPFQQFDEESCPNGIFRAEASNCAKDIRYPIPSAGKVAFYTTWSFYTCMISVGLFLVYLLMTLVGKGKKQTKFRNNVLNNKTFQLIMIGIVAMPALNSIGVLSTSQLLLAKNFKLLDKDGNVTTKNLALSTKFFNSSMNINLDSHIVPGLLGICVLIGLSLTRHKARPWKWNVGIACFIILLNLLLVSLWMSVPVLDDNDDDKPKVWFDKLKLVYADPAAWFFVVQFAMVFILSFVVAFRIA